MPIAFTLWLVQFYAWVNGGDENDEHHEIYRHTISNFCIHLADKTKVRRQSRLSSTDATALELSCTVPKVCFDRVLAPLPKQASAQNPGKPFCLAAEPGCSVTGQDCGENAVSGYRRLLNKQRKSLGTSETTPEQKMKLPFRPSSIFMRMNRIQ